MSHPTRHAGPTVYVLADTPTHPLYFSMHMAKSRGSIRDRIAPLMKYAWAPSEEPEPMIPAGLAPSYIMPLSWLPPRKYPDRVAVRAKYVVAIVGAQLFADDDILYVRALCQDDDGNDMLMDINAGRDSRVLGPVAAVIKYMDRDDAFVEGEYVSLVEWTEDGEFSAVDMWRSSLSALEWIIRRPSANTPR